MSDDFNNDSLMELYLYESTSLLDSLDDILLDAESEQNLSQENVNEIFRIMHTIKGSSAMMAYTGISEVAHKTEDMFSFIRDSGLKQDFVAELFDLVLAVSDFLKTEISKVQEGMSLETDTIALTDTIQNLTNRLKEGTEPTEPKMDIGRMLGGIPSSAPESEPKPQVKTPEPISFSNPEPEVQPSQEETPLPGESPAEASVVILQTKEPVQESFETEPPNGKMLGAEQEHPDNNTEVNADISKITSRVAVNNNNSKPNEPTTYFLHVHFNEGSKMENIRAFMLVNKLSEKGTVNQTIPSSLENNPGAATLIVERGLYISYTSTLFREQIESLAKGTLSVETVAFVRKLPDDLDSGSRGEESLQVAPVLRSEIESNDSAQDNLISQEPQIQAQPDISTQNNESVNEDSYQIAPVENNITTQESAALDAPQPAVDQTPRTDDSHASHGVDSHFDANNNPVHPAQATSSNAPAKQSIISVDLKKLDSLLDLVGEIVINESIVSENPDLEGLELTNFRKATRQLGKLTNELQDTVMSIRMLPVSIVFQRMRRIVRDMSKSLDKDVDLILAGESTEVDKTILDALSDPIMHLVRNAMDHAIETREERIASGKNTKGHIILSAQNSGGDIIISISDDGKGLDQNVILAKAREKGLLRKPEDEYTPKEIHGLLMAPGFSTKENVTEFSGRGVGLDVVKSNIEKIGGTVIIESRKGQGTNIMLKIPLTLAIISCMQIRLGLDVYSIPINNIKESFKADGGQLITDPVGNEMIMLRGVAYPIIRLYELFGQDDAIQNIEEGILVLVESDDKFICLLADSLVGKFQVVVKPLPQYLNRFNMKSSGISGCTIMGNGNISLILNVQELT